MAKESKMKEADNIEMAKLQALEQENRLLKEQIEQQEKAHQESLATLGGNITNEIKKITQKGKSSANSITVTEINDHVNVSLWTKWGDRIGPLHPDNAIQALHRFANMGVILSVDKPTHEQVQAFYASPEGKRFLKKDTENREHKLKSKRSGQMERLCNEIAKMSGTTVDAINKILSPREVGKKEK